MSNERVGPIARWQAIKGGFVVASSHSLKASEGNDDDDDADEDDGASLSSDDEMSTWCTYPLSLVTKRRSSFDIRVVIYIGGELA